MSASAPTNGLTDLRRVESADERAPSGKERTPRTTTTRAQFEAYLERQFEAIRQINRTKGRDYTGDEDALANLRDMPRAGITGTQKLWVYLEKHLRAIETYVREGQVESEPIEGRIHDAVLYLLLFGAFVEEQREQAGAGAEHVVAEPERRVCGDENYVLGEPPLVCVQHPGHFPATPHQNDNGTSWQPITFARPDGV